ncbi:MAG: F0F1 ATP synthase subunit B' [Beijerinckiaceae bacterium]|jgi:F-type H+-transporting ATPase subunit b|nr:F0F1 ATP synthase subunit B' [Beijerinckiaceae bacterium]MDO9441267.1 F0F1 ATP synthase subunit B' [Beijerinckiaceae bacterium]
MATTDKAAVTAGTAAPDGAHAQGVFPPFDSTTFAPQLIWLALIFGALYLLMSRVALPRVERILENRRARIAGDLDEASAMQHRAQAASLAYDKTLADAKGKAQTLAQQMRDQLAADSDAKRKALEADLNARLVAAEASISQTKAQAMTHVGEIAAQAASDIVRHITGKPADEQAIARAMAATKTV